MNARRFGRVDDLGHVLAGQVEDVGVVVARRGTRSTSSRERLLLGREVEVHAGRSSRNLTTRQVSGVGAELPSVGDDAVGARAVDRGVVEAELRRAAPRAVCSPTQGTRARGPRPSSTASPGCRARAPARRRRRCAASRRACCAWRRAGRRCTSARGCTGPRRCPPRSARAPPRASCVCDAHASTAGRIIVLEVRAPSRRASRSAGRRSTRGARRARRAALELVLAHDLHDERSRRTRGSPSQITCERLVGFRRARPSDQKLVTMSVIATIGVVHRDVDVLALAGAVAVAQRGEDADDARTAPS